MKYGKKRNRPDKDGKDRTAFTLYKNKLLNECAEDGFIKCSICGLPINVSLHYPNPWSLTIDHIIPISKGGTTHPDNLAPAHFRCNRRKGEKLELTIDEINVLRSEQHAQPLVNRPLKRINLGYIADIPPEERYTEQIQIDLDRAARGFPLSRNWLED